MMMPAPDYIQAVIPMIRARKLISPLSRRHKGDLIPDFISAILTEKDITDETEMIFDGICISAACDLAVKTQKREMITYL